MPPQTKSNHAEGQIIDYHENQEPVKSFNNLSSHMRLQIIKKLGNLFSVREFTL